MAFCTSVHAQRGRAVVQADCTVRGVEAGEQLEHPLLVFARHALEAAPALGGQAHDPRAAVAGLDFRARTRPSRSSSSVSAVTLPPVTIR